MRYQVLFFLKPYKLLYGTVLAVTLCSSALESLSVVAFFPLFSSLLGHPGREQDGILGSITGMVGLLPFSDSTVAASVLLIGLFLLKAGVTLLREWLIACASGRALYEVGSRIMERYAGAHYQFFLDSRQGSLMYNSLVAPHRIALLLLRVPQMVADLFKIMAMIIVLVFVSPLVTLALAVLGLGYFGVIHYLSKKVSYHLGQGRTNASTEQTIIVNEFLSGIRQIMIFRTAERWLERFRGEYQTFINLYVKDTVWMAIPKNLMEMTAIVVMMGVILVLRSSSPDTFTANLPTLGVFAMALLQLLPTVSSFGRMRMEMLGLMPDAELVYEAMTQPILRRQDGDKALGAFEKAIVFEKVSFAHKGRDPLLRDMNLTFEKGKVTAVVGPSGVGKTTIINLVLGLFEPSEGKITIDGVPLQEYKLETWLSKVGFVSQEPFIYHSAIADNITFSRDGHSMESVIHAAKIANAHGFISEFPQGYDTVAGDRGMRLSGGQQQRIAIARAVLNEPEILIFDEATSSLDSISEKLVQEAIDNVSRDRTVIIIAHRLSTIRYADKIIVLDEGRVVEEGSHQELLERQGHYSRLVASSR
jgi:ABC-type multidrug transport system fused ATPase/permease subunit